MVCVSYAHQGTVRGLILLLLFPWAAYRCCQHLSVLSRGRQLLLGAGASVELSSGASASATAGLSAGASAGLSHGFGSPQARLKVPQQCSLQAPLQSSLQAPLSLFLFLDSFLNSSDRFLNTNIISSILIYQYVRKSLT